MSEQIPELGDKIRICYSKHVYHGFEGRIVRMDSRRECLQIELTMGELTWVGCDDYEFIAGAGGGFAYFRWDTLMNTKLFGWQQALTQSPMSETPHAVRIWRERNA